MSQSVVIRHALHFIAEDRPGRFEIPLNLLRRSTDDRRYHIFRHAQLIAPGFCPISSADVVYQRLVGDRLIIELGFS